MLLDYYVLPVDYGVAYGSVTLKSLQNDNIPELDLLVRESIQNSSDASLQEPGDFYKVAYTTGRFEPENFNSLITGLEDKLNRRFFGKKTYHVRFAAVGEIDGDFFGSLSLSAY